MKTKELKQLTAKYPKIAQVVVDVARWDRNAAKWILRYLRTCTKRDLHEMEKSTPSLCNMFYWGSSGKGTTYWLELTIIIEGGYDA